MATVTQTIPPTNTKELIALQEFVTIKVGDLIEWMDKTI